MLTGLQALEASRNLYDQDSHSSAFSYLGVSHEDGVLNVMGFQKNSVEEGCANGDQRCHLAPSLFRAFCHDFQLLRPVTFFSSNRLIPIKKMLRVIRRPRTRGHGAFQARFLRLTALTAIGNR